MNKYYTVCDADDMAGQGFITAYGWLYHQIWLLTSELLADGADKDNLCVYVHSKLFSEGIVHYHGQIWHLRHYSANSISADLIKITSSAGIRLLRVRNFYERFFLGKAKAVTNCVKIEDI